MKLAELIAGGFIFPDLQKCVGQVFANGCTGRRERDCLSKAGDGSIVIFLAQILVCTFQGLIGRISGLSRDRAESQR